MIVSVNGAADDVVIHEQIEFYRATTGSFDERLGTLTTRRTASLSRSTP